jgi:hypothetical protein
MEKQIKHLKTLLVAEQFVVTGSYALSKFGLDIEATDLDIILVKPTEEAISILKRLQSEYPAKTKPVEGVPMFIFKQDDVKVDVFVYESAVDALPIGDVLYSKINRIVAAKKSFKRFKDVVQLRKLSKMFYEPKDIQELMDAKENQKFEVNY